MCIIKGVLYREIITVPQEYKIDKLINPSFIVVGTSPVIIDGERFVQGEAFVINSPNIELSGSIQIEFETKFDRRIFLRATKLITDCQN